MRSIGNRKERQSISYKQYAISQDFAPTQSISYKQNAINRELQKREYISFKRYAIISDLKECQSISYKQYAISQHLHQRQSISYKQYAISQKSTAEEYFKFFKQKHGMDHFASSTYQTNRLKMALSKESLYLDSDRRTCNIAKAISHPARLLLLDQLKDGPLEFCQLAEDHPLSQPALSQHLRILRRARLVECECHGRMSIYQLIEENQPTWLLAILQKKRTMRRYTSAA